MTMYTLTEMTGRRKNDDRTIHAATFTFNRYNVFVTAGSVAASLPVAALAAGLLAPFGWSMWALVVPVLGVFVGMFLGSRVRDGQQRQYSKMLDKRLARNGKGRGGVAEGNIVYVAGEPLVNAQLSEMVQSFIPNPEFITDQAAQSPDGHIAPSFVPAIGKADSTRDRSTVKRSFL